MGRAVEASRIAGVLSSDRLSKPGSPDCRATQQNLRGGFRGAPNANGTHAARTLRAVHTAQSGGDAMSTVAIPAEVMSGRLRRAPGSGFRHQPRPPLRRGRNGRRRPPRRLARRRRRQADRRHGAVGLRQVDADAHPRRARPADRAAASRSTASRSRVSNDTQLTKLRREHIGFVFQFFNLLPMLNGGGEHRPAARDRRPQAGAGRGSRSCSSSVGLADRRTHRPGASSPAASSSASPSPGRWSPGRR